MNCINRVSEISRIFERLVDEESRKIFEARLEYIFDRDMEKLMDSLWDISNYKEYENEQLARYFRTHDKSKVIIFGAGKYGRKTKMLLERFGINILYFCDNDKNKIGKVIDNILCLSVDNVCQNYKDYTVIPISPLHIKDLYNQLISDFFPQENILYLRGGKLDLVCEKQYFDFDKVIPNSKDIFVDAGAYNGQTISDFIEWCGGNYSRIYSFEPNENNFKLVYNRFSEQEKINVINAGTWNIDGELSFVNNGPASKISDSESDCSIKVATIDSVVKNDKVTFIKMDVEGAEFESIQGARNTIINNRPNLAICVYHKWLDFIDLPKAILDIVPDYKFAIRHYSNNTTETVLYAFIESGV